MLPPKREFKFQLGKLKLPLNSCSQSKGGAVVVEDTERFCLPSTLFIPPTKNTGAANFYLAFQLEIKRGHPDQAK